MGRQKVGVEKGRLYFHMLRELVGKGTLLLQI